MSLDPDTARAAFERLQEALSEKAELMRENARLREALTGLYQALRERHHGRMPDEVRVAYEQAAAALVGEERVRVLSEVAEANRRAVAEQEHGWRE